MLWYRIYSKKEHKKKIMATLGNENEEDAINIDAHNHLNGKPIIDTSGGTNFFAKGHLAPGAAFIYKLEKAATYYFINVAPQFQSFNGRNWADVEKATRNVARRCTHCRDRILEQTYQLSLNLNYQRHWFCISSIKENNMGSCICFVINFLFKS